MINIMYCGNKKAFDGIMLSLMSLVKHNNETINAYILTMDLHEENEEYLPISNIQIVELEKVLKEKNRASSIFPFNLTDIYKKEMLNSPNNKTVYTPYCLLRLFSDCLDLPDKILYLDIDTMINNDISELYNINIDKYEIAGVKDYMGKVFRAFRYINSGVLLINTKMIKETKLFTKARVLIKEKKMWFPDQDALNKLVKHKLILARKYNEQRAMKTDTIIKHFCKGIKFFPIFKIYNIKPWEIERVQKSLKIKEFDDIFKEYTRRRGMIKC